MTVDFVARLISVLVTLQFVAFGWRINREIAMGDEGHRTWFPIPDFINTFSLISAVWFSIIVPLKTGQFGMLAKLALVIGYVFIAFHPISMAAHYRLWSKSGRSIYKTQGKDFPYLTGQEAFCVCISVVVAAVVGCYFLHG